MLDIRANRRTTIAPSVLRADIKWINHAREADTDPEDLLALAEYLLPARASRFVVEHNDALIRALTDWVDDAPEALRQAWLHALHQAGRGEARLSAAHLLHAALVRAETGGDL